MYEILNAVFVGLSIPFFIVSSLLWFIIVILLTGNIESSEKITNIVGWIICLCVTLYYGYNCLLPLGRMIFTGEFK